MPENDRFTKRDIPYLAHPAFLIVALICIALYWATLLFFELTANTEDGLMFCPYIIDLVIAIGFGAIAGPQYARALIAYSAEAAVLCKEKPSLRLHIPLSESLYNSNPQYQMAHRDYYLTTQLTYLGFIACAVAVVWVLFILLPELPPPWARFALVDGNIEALLFRSIASMLFPYFLTLHIVCLKHIWRWYNSLPEGKKRKAE